jgi:hypothetical protein
MWHAKKAELQLRGRYLMVNWRENIEFCYGLFILISAIVVFFNFYNSKGVIFAGEVAVAITITEIVIGVAAFETDWAINRWEKIGKNEQTK